MTSPVRLWQVVEALSEESAGAFRGGEQLAAHPVGEGLSGAFGGSGEFGYCLKLSADSDYSARMSKLIPWRGPRDERDWPEALHAGGAWPWTPLSREVARFAS